MRPAAHHSHHRQHRACFASPDTLTLNSTASSKTSCAWSKSTPARNCSHPIPFRSATYRASTRNHTGNATDTVSDIVSSSLGPPPHKGNRL
jgi:hypothetical protein